ncbi:hypothetical protein IU448_14320 [Nocardia flavorosea]|uniref:hypothetical protein n=1 Tax=Nocardia flavorosea TaxID=53429 RepID=UPI001895B453|nr:hypothetical protein [Nocardia flavorosea]MBF6350182.1 hypothetical protein [Nocardia flavorosea]
MTPLGTIHLTTLCGLPARHSWTTLSPAGLHITRESAARYTEPAGTTPEDRGMASPTPADINLIVTPEE